MKRHCFNLFVGLIALSGFNAAALTRYVDLNSPSPTPPYTSWAVAATNIQDAIDAADAGDLVLVTNGVYSSGGRVVHGAVTNRVALITAITVQSVNGPTNTIILGGGGGLVRCAYLTNGAVLSGFTLTNGSLANGGDFVLENSGAGAWGEGTNAFVLDSIIVGNYASYFGGGVYSCTISNCSLVANTFGGARSAVIYESVLANNTIRGGANSCELYNCVLSNNTCSTGGGASYSTLSNCLLIANFASSFGGGAYQCTLRGCKLINNSTLESGGGARWSTLRNCLLFGNSAGAGGGTRDCVVINCTLVNNLATEYAGGVCDGLVHNSIILSNQAGLYSNHNFTSYSGIVTGLSYSCTSPLPLNNLGNIDTFSGFMDYQAADFRLVPNSPCVNAGNNSYVSDVSDIDSKVRIVGGTVDLGAWEDQTPSSTLSYAWAQKYGLVTDGAVDFDDPDGDGATNWQESCADTNPTNAASVFRLVSVRRVLWRNYPVPEISWLAVPTREYRLERTTNFESFEVIATNISGASGLRTWIDYRVWEYFGGRYFFRVRVQ